MKNRRFILVLSLLLIATLLISGCPPFRRPAPERQPAPAPGQPAPAPGQPVPGQPVPGQPAPGQPPQGIDPGRQPTAPDTGPGVQPRQQPAPGAMDLAERVADMATDVQGVDQATVVVISNLALVGITIERGAGRNEVEIKREVASIVEDREPSIVNAYVSANPDIVRQLQEISRGIQRGEPITTFFDQITEVLRRMRAETNNQ